MNEIEKLKDLYCKWCPREQECDENLTLEEKRGCLACDGFADELLKVGYLLVEEVQLEGLVWIDEPTERGEYWVSAFCDGRYISPSIISVIDYERPERGLEVQESIGRDTVPVKEYCSEWYPQAKWMKIHEPPAPGRVGKFIR
jgi:hypothetical protein